MTDVHKNGNESCDLDYSKIIDFIYLGSDFCCGRNCKDHAQEFGKLGVKVELVLTEEEKEIPPDDLDLYAWIPVKDKTAPTNDQFDLGTSIINQAVVNEKIIYIHCMNGHGRSPTMLASYFIKFKKMTANEAMKRVIEKRSEVHFEEAQSQALKEYEKKWLK